MVFGYKGRGTGRSHPLFLWLCAERQHKVGSNRRIASKIAESVSTFGRKNRGRSPFTSPRSPKRIYFWSQKPWPAPFHKIFAPPPQQKIICGKGSFPTRYSRLPMTRALHKTGGLPTSPPSTSFLMDTNPLFRITSVFPARFASKFPPISHNRKHFPTLHPTFRKVFAEITVVSCHFFFFRLLSTDVHVCGAVSFQSYIFDLLRRRCSASLAIHCAS